MKDWVFLIEDFDKESVADQVLDQLFVRYRNIWSELDVKFHLHHSAVVDLRRESGRSPAAPMHSR